MHVRMVCVCLVSRYIFLSCLLVASWVPNYPLSKREKTDDSRTKVHDFAITNARGRRASRTTEKTFPNVPSESLGRCRPVQERECFFYFTVACAIARR